MQTFKLRSWRPEDVAPYLDFYASDPLSCYSGGPMSAARAWRHLASVIGHWTLRGYGVWAIEDLSSGTLCGCGGAWQPDGWSNPEFAFWFTSEVFERGLALEGARSAFEAVCQDHGRQALISYVHTDHRAYRDIIVTLGGSHAGSTALDGTAHDIYHFA